MLARISILLFGLSGLVSFAFAGELIERVETGSELSALECDRLVRRLETQALSGEVQGLLNRQRSDDADVRRAASTALHHLRGNPARELASWGASDQRQDTVMGAAERALTLVRLLGAGDELMIAAKWARLASKEGDEFALRSPVSTAALEALKRSKDRGSSFVGAYDHLPDGLVRIWVDVLRKRASAADLRIAHRLLGRRPLYDSIILNRLQVLIRHVEPDFTEPQLAGLRSYLGHESVDCRKESAALLAQLGDRKAIKPLLRLLDDSVRDVRLSGHAALKSLTGIRFGASPGRWQRWHRDEEAWWQSQGHDLVSKMERLPKKPLLGSLNALTQHPLYRVEIGAEVEKLLSRDDEMTVRMALSVLESIRAVDQAEAIRQLCRDRRPKVAIQARTAYKRLKGRSWDGARRG